jgi:hypothetical protein
MARGRLPAEKAAASGAAIKNPQRFQDRKAPKRTRPVGEPYANMTDDQKAAWEEFRYELPWLNSGHRALLRLVCILTARMNDPEFGVSAMHALSSALSKLGATPVDETKVNHGGDEEEDSTNKFFTRPH